MKKRVLCCMAVLLILSLAACAAPAPQGTQPADQPVAGTGGIVVFADPVLEAMVRGAMGKPEGDITAAEAAAVTTLSLAAELSQENPERERITDISGLESFQNLEVLDLSNQAVTNLMPLSGLKNLHTLMLSNCQAADYTPLKQLTNLNVLSLDYAAISDLSVLSGLNNLVFLSLAHTRVCDLSPLVALANIRFLYLSGCPIQSYAPIADRYPLLQKKDFTIAEYLSDLGFTFDEGKAVAEFRLDGVTLQVSHTKWGTPPEDLLWLSNSIQMKDDRSSDYSLITGYYPEKQVWELAITSHGETLASYVYLPESGDFIFGIGERASAEEAVRATLGDKGTDDILLALIPAFQDVIVNAFSMTPDALYALPNVRPSLLNLGFVVNKENAYCEFTEKRDLPEGERYYNICVHRSEWGEQDYDVRFFTPINGFGLVITDFVDELLFSVSADNQTDGSYAVFDYDQKDGSVIDKEVSKGVTVEEYFTNVYNDPGVKDVYRHSVSIMEEYIADTFGLSVEELYALPTGE